MCIDLRCSPGIELDAGNRTVRCRWATNNEVRWSGMNVPGRGRTVARCGPSPTRSRSGRGVSVPPSCPAFRLRRPIVAMPAFVPVGPERASAR